MDSTIEARDEAPADDSGGSLRSDRDASAAEYPAADDDVSTDPVEPTDEPSNPGPAAGGGGASADPNPVVDAGSGEGSGGAPLADPSCGDGEQQDPEQCDDGNDDDGDGCRVDCTFTCTVDDQCDDDNACTLDVCDADAHTCSNTPSYDFDGAECRGGGRCSGGTCTTTGNLLANPGFEDDAAAVQSPSGWVTWSDGSWQVMNGTVSQFDDADFTEKGAAHRGKYRLSHYLANTSTWHVYTYQVLSGLENGRYTLRAWARRSGDGFGEAQLEVKDFNDTIDKLNVQIPNSTTYELIEVSDIEITTATATVGVWTVVDDASNSPRVEVDSVEFFKP